MLSLKEMNGLATVCGYPIPEHTDEGYMVSARRIHKALKISIPFAVWFASARHEIEFEKGEDYTPIKHDIDGKMLKDYYVTLTIAGDMGLMCRTSYGEDFANFYGEYRQVIRCDQLHQLEKRIEKMERNLGITPAVVQ